MDKSSATRCFSSGESASAAAAAAAAADDDDDDDECGIVFDALACAATVSFAGAFVVVGILFRACARRFKKAKVSDDRDA